MGENMNEKQYNGWSNYETWAVKLWIDNDEGSQEYWNERASEAKDVYSLSQELQTEHEENTPAVTGVYADLLNASLSEVNWHEIAEALREDAGVEEEEEDE
jgi:hypothetical protein